MGFFAEQLYAALICRTGTGSPTRFSQALEGLGAADSHAPGIQKAQSRFFLHTFRPQSRHYP